MRTIGPFISFMFYLTQALHAYMFYFSVAPAILLKYPNSCLAILWITLGWMLFIKVTYTYWWVSSHDPGSL